MTGSYSKKPKNRNNVVSIERAFKKSKAGPALKETHDLEYDDFVRYLNDALPDEIATNFPTIIGNILKSLEACDFCIQSMGYNDKAEAARIKNVHVILYTKPLSDTLWKEFLGEYSQRLLEHDPESYFNLMSEAESSGEDKALSLDFISKTESYKVGTTILEHHFPEIAARPSFLKCSGGRVILAVNVRVPEGEDKDLMDYLRQYLERRRNPGLSLVRDQKEPGP